MRFLIIEVVPVALLIALLYAAIGHPVSFRRALIIGGVLGLLRLHAVWIMGLP